MIEFQHLLTGPVGARGPRFDPAIQALSGRRVQIRGYMVTHERGHAGLFYLAPRPLLLSEHADGMADDLPATTIAVLLSGRDADMIPLPTPGVMQLTGTWQFGRREMADGRISWLQLLLDPREGLPVAESSGSPGLVPAVR